MALSGPTMLVNPIETEVTGNISTGAFTPSANALVVVVFNISGAAAATGTWADTAMTVTGGSGMGAWTQIQAGSASTNGAAIHAFYAQAPASPASMTCTASVSGVSNRVYAFEVTGQDATTPVAGANGAFNAMASPSLTLTATPETDDYVIGLFTSRNDVNGMDPGSGFTQFVEAYDAATPSASVFGEYQTNTTSTTVDGANFQTTRTAFVGFIVKAAHATSTPISGSDTASGSEAVTILSVSLTAADTSTAADAATLNVTLSVTDTATAVEGQTKADLGNDRQSPDTGSSAEAAGVVAQITPSETAPAATETAALAAQVGSYQPAPTSEQASLLATIPGQSQSSVGVEAATLLVSVTAADTATITEAVSLLATMAAADTGSSSEGQTADKPGAKDGVESSTTLESSSVARTGSTADARPATEAASLSATVPLQTQAGVSADSAILLVTLSRTETAGSTEAASLRADLSDAEPVASMEVATLVAVLTAADLLAAVEGTSLLMGGVRNWRSISAGTDSSGGITVSVHLSGGREANITIKRLEG